jgi:hypothetical protein
MTIKETLVTPEIATKWLEGNTHNRTLRQSVVERYARDMKAGKWQLTPECIAFDFNKTLVDGQHRLWAVIESETATRFMVAYDVRPEVRAVINAGLVRTDTDHLKFGYGLNVTPMHSAVAKRVLQSPIGRTKATVDEIRLFLATHAKALDFALSAFPRVVRGITTAPIYTVVLRAHYHAEEERLRQFAEVLCTGRMTNTNEEPILLLRNFLLERAPSDAAVVYAKTERALMAYLNNESPHMLYSASSELFPLPEERTTTRRLGHGNKIIKVAAGKKSVKKTRRGGVTHA